MIVNTKSAKSRKSDLNLQSKQKSAGTPFGFAVDDDDQVMESDKSDPDAEDQIQPFVPEDEDEDEIEEESSPDV
jgi:hypothetical protein